MRQVSKVALLGVAMGLTGAAQAADITLSGNITTSTTLTANNVYNLSGDVRVLPGVTLTIEAGTVFATVTGPTQGSLIVARGGKIFANGTKSNPIIFTSANDRATWVANNPKTGTWRAAANEWGSVAIMGRAYISNTLPAGNTAVPSANNLAPMEGLTAQFVGDPNVLFGGENDEDDSGSLSYVSIRYGGKVLALNSELNGISLGGVGRETDISFLEIMNNVDDGIEIFGGTVNIKYFSVWNIGDDSFDVDQGWRGKAQFGLIVQGYSVAAGSGSGFPDNGFESDGANGEASAQPVTASVLYNMTFIGQPESIAGSTADAATSWRDNCNLQFRNCIFMDTGGAIVEGNNSRNDGDSPASTGYGSNGTLQYDVRWTTSFNHNHLTTNPNTGGFLTAQLQALYPAQVDGNLIEIKDSVFFNNTDAAGTDQAYTEADARLVFAAQNNNVREPATMPIIKRTRKNTAPEAATFSGRTVNNVIDLDPRAAGDAVTSVGTAPNDGFFAQAKFRGAFSKDVNWLLGWTASDAYGYHAGQTNPADPAVTIAVQLTTVSFLTAVGMNYRVDVSSDGGLTWSPVVVTPPLTNPVAGDGTTKTVSDVIGGAFVATKIYRVVIQ